MKQNNPIIPGKGVCDPHIHIFQDKAYLYASHDKSLENTTWLMEDWQIWSSENLVDWNFEANVKPEDTYIGASNTCWAVDAAERNNKYYYYFSNGNTDTGVAVSDSPIGPFTDALGKPILSEGLTKTAQYDPTVFVDPDTDIPYIIWGWRKRLLHCTAAGKHDCFGGGTKADIVGWKACMGRQEFFT